MRLCFVTIVLVALAAAGLVPSARASTQSRDLVARGAVDLSQDKFDAALKNFEDAAKADPADSEAVYFQAVALNRLARHADAMAALDRATSMGYSHRDVALERGWAQVGTKKYDDAIKSLDQFELSDPGRGQTSLLMGQAYRGKGDTAKAEASFNEAARRDPTLAPQTTKLLAEIKGTAAPATATAPTAPAGPTAQLATTGSPRSNSLRSRPTVGDTVTVTREETGVSAKTWSRRPRGSVGIAFGNNTNVIALGDVTLAGEITGTNGRFQQMFADLSWDWQYNEHNGLTLGYFGTVTSYDNLSAFDLTDHTGYLTYRHLFQPHLSGTLSLADNYTELGGLEYRNLASIRPALTYLCSNGNSLELALFYSRNAYFFPTIPVFDRSGDTESVSLTSYFRVKNTKLSGRLGYYHLWNSAIGSDFDFDSNGVVLGLSHPIGNRGANIFGFYSHTWDDYDNPNSLTAFTFARREQTDRFSLQLSVPIQHQIYAFARFERTDVRSNIAAYTFDQNITSGGVVTSF